MRVKLIQIKITGLGAPAMSQKTFVSRDLAANIKGKSRASRFLAQLSDS